MNDDYQYDLLEEAGFNDWLDAHKAAPSLASVILDITGRALNKDKQTGHAWCPKCNQRVNGYFSESSDMSHFWLVEYKYCPNCGQKLNWEGQSAL